MKNHLTLFLFIFFSSISYAVIIESDKLSTVFDYISEPETLVIFDLDNTLIRSEKELGSDEWFCYLVNKKMLEGHDYLTAIHYTVPASYYVQFNIKMQPTEKTVPAMLNQLIEQNIPIIALTSRSLFTAEATLAQLEDINIYFYAPGIDPQNLVLQMSLPCFYKNWVLFSGNNNKGETLIYFFHLKNYFPKTVIFVDDKMEHHIALEKALTEIGINYYGIRYSGCDELVKNFDAIKAEEQYKDLRQERPFIKHSASDSLR